MRNAGFLLVIGLLLLNLGVHAQEVRLRGRGNVQGETTVSHVIVGMAPGRYRVVCGPDTMYVQCTENSMHFRGRVVSPTHVVRIPE